jgi:WhiB family redox-sensing transcriptional regulator
MKPDCNQSPRLITGQRLSLTVRLHGRVCSEPDIVRLVSGMEMHVRVSRPGLAGAPTEGGTMPVRMSGRRANFPGPTQVAITLGPRHNNAEVLPQPILGPSDSYDSIARPKRPANATCRGMGPDFFFPTSGVGIARATRVCARCPVAEECLATALDDSSLHGIWGGTSARDRQYLRSEEGLGWG